ncbi:MAG: SIMPL domain-containing protein [Patescibacteria group bacterium]|nr:SIMPL domain-containing protein [Patescibacteria group bacterium]
MNNGNLIEKNKNLFSVFAVVLIAFLVCLIVLIGVNIVNKIKQGEYIGQEIEMNNIITVSGTGEVYAKPDLVLISFSVKNEAKTVSEAMNENAKKMNAVISFMKEQGIEDKDLKTTIFNIYPQYEYRKDRTELYPIPSGKRVLVGYEINQTLQIKIRDIGKTGALIQGAADIGANQLGNLQMTIDNKDEFKKQARKQAIEEAKEKAKELASQLGVKLVRIINFSEGNTIPNYYGLERVGIMGDGDKEAPQIETGENKIEVRVMITYKIR